MIEMDVIELPSLRRHELAYMNKNGGDVGDRLAKMYVRAFDIP